MAVPLILAVAAAAVQQPGPPPGNHAPLAAPRFERRLFMSPMGEPFFERGQGQDGLTIWFQQADSNHDGVLTADELAQDAQRFFLTLDTNHDGEIDPDEITHYETAVAPSGLANDEAGAGRFGLLQIPEPVASADTNFNRGVSADEFRAAAAARFQLLDASHTGRLTLTELETIRHAAASESRRRPTTFDTPDVGQPPTGDDGGAPMQPGG
jgi:Ca2+-binding EF-hand superfamily protein